MTVPPTVWVPAAGSCAVQCFCLAAIQGSANLLCCSKSRRHSRAGGIALGFFSGLMLDVFQSPVLGEHALALSCITYVAVREHQKIRSKPAFQQSLIVFAVLVAYESILFAIDGWTHHPITSPLRWTHTLTGAIFWAPVAAVLNATNDRRR